MSVFDSDHSDDEFELPDQDLDEELKHCKSILESGYV
jgi:hypothetical protein